MPLVYQIKLFPLFPSLVFSVHTTAAALLFREKVQMKAIAIYNCTADDDEELSFKEGDILTDVKKSNEDGWYEGRLEATNSRGLFPYNYVKFITESATSKAIPRSTLGASNNTAAMDNQFSASVSPPNSTLSSTWSVISTRDDDTIDHHHHHHQSTPAPPLSSSSATRPLYPPMSATMTATNTTPSPPPPATPSFNNNNNDKALKAADAFEKAIMQQQKPTTLKPTSKPAGTSVVPLTLTEDKDHKPATAPKPAQLRKTSISSPSSSVASRVRSFSTSAAQHNDTPDTTRPRNNSNAMPIIRPKPYATKSTASSTTVNRPGKMNNGTPNREQRMEKVIFDNDVVEDDDGYQVVTPSLLRQRQPSSMITTKSAAFSTKPVLPAPSKMATAAVASKPIMSDTKPFFVSSSSSSSPSPASSHKPTPVASPTRGKEQSSKLADLPTATNPAPKLPSRPVSTASRRPRSSRSTSTTPSVSKANTPSPTMNAAIIEKKQTPPAPHPKPPQLSQDTSSSTSPRAKGRSVSNPPPLQPKPSFSAKQSAIKPEVPVQSKPEVIRKPPPPPPTQAAATPALPVRPVAARREQFEQSDNTANRARSKSNGWKPPSTTSNTPPLLPARTNAIPVAQRQPPPPPSSSIMEKKTPPPPPPSRPVQSTYRYEELFNAINDDGIVDGETARVIWKRSKVPDDVLARIWQQCDPKGCGMLNKAAFIQGMREIDTVLAQKSFA